MRKVISVAFAILLAFLGMQNNVQTTQGNKASGFTKSFCDDDPIIMHSRVRTSGGGIPIAGASVNLIPSGTTVPLYTGITDSNGNYTFDSVAQGNYTYKVSATDYYTKTAGVSLHVETTRTDSLVAK